MTIRFKGPQGRIDPISRRRFRREFGVEYLSGLKLPRERPEDFLDQSAAFASAAAERMSPRERRAYGRKISRGYVVPCYIAKVGDEVGYGLFAGRDIRRGEMIGEYVGLLTRDWPAELKKPSDLKPYLFRYPFASAYAVDAERHGNETRFINHSSAESNVARRYLRLGGVVHAILVADKAVAEDGQFLLDYGERYWSFRSPARIRPGAAGSELRPPARPA